MDALRYLEQTLHRFPDSVLLTLAQCLVALADPQDSRESLVPKLAKRLLSPDARWLLSQQVQVYQQFYQISLHLGLPNDCPCNTLGGLPVNCSKCWGTQHFLCVFKLIAPPRPYVCPKCQLLGLSPLAPVIACLTPCFALIGNCAASTPICFDVDEDLLRRIRNGRGTVQVQLRCMRLSAEGGAGAWPERGALLVNGKVAAEFGVHRQGPLTLTNLLHVGKNSLTLIKLTDHEAYVALLCAVNVMDPHNLAQQILLKATGTAATHKKALLAKLKTDTVVIDSVRIPLKCPLSFEMIRTPARGSDCQHFECFDLHAFLELQTSTSKWKCPVCAQICKELVVDKFLLKVLSTASRPFAGVELSSTGVCRRYKETHTVDFIVIE